MNNGKADKAKGKVKQAVGDLTGNRKLQRSGRMQETKGKVKAKIGRAVDKI